VIDYLREENRVLRDQLGARGVRFTDDQRVRLAAKAKKIGRRALTEIGTLVTPDTLRPGIGIWSPASTPVRNGAGRDGRA